jgi:hypothetical protein
MPGGASSAVNDALPKAKPTFSFMAGMCVAPRRPSGTRDAVAIPIADMRNGTTTMATPSAASAVSKRRLPWLIGGGDGSGSDIGRSIDRRSRPCPSLAKTPDECHVLGPP